LPFRSDTWHWPRSEIRHRRARYSSDHHEQGPFGRNPEKGGANNAWRAGDRRRLSPGYAAKIPAYDLLPDTAAVARRSWGAHRPTA